MGNAINGSLDCYGYVPEAVGFAANLPSTSQNPVQDLFPSVVVSPPAQSSHFQASWQLNTHAWVIDQNVLAMRQMNDVHDLAIVLNSVFLMHLYH